MSGPAAIGPAGISHDPNRLAQSKIGFYPAGSEMLEPTEHIGSVSQLVVLSTAVPTVVVNGASQ